MLLSPEDVERTILVSLPTISFISMEMESMSWVMVTNLVDRMMTKENKTISKEYSIITSNPFD